MYEHLWFTSSSGLDTDRGVSLTSNCRHDSSTLPGFGHEDDQRQHQKDHNTLHPETHNTVATSRIIHCLYYSASKLIISHPKDFLYNKVPWRLNLTSYLSTAGLSHREQIEHSEIYRWCGRLCQAVVSHSSFYKNGLI